MISFDTHRKNVIKSLRSGMWFATIGADDKHERFYFKYYTEKGYKDNVNLISDPGEYIFSGDLSEIGLSGNNDRLLANPMLTRKLTPEERERVFEYLYNTDCQYPDYTVLDWNEE